MKPLKLLALSLTIAALLSVIPAQAVKPTGNLASAKTILWNLSGAVMPVPPYGSGDIVGSDTASKLIVNQPNGNTEVTLTGVMNGLHPNTIYTVWLGQGYTPYVFTGWSVVGTWVIRLHYGASIYVHDIEITVQNDGTFSGIGGYPAGGYPYNYPYHETITGTINVMTGAVTIHSEYENTYFLDATGTIAADGTMSGTWHGSGQPTYAWESISGAATKTHTGDTWYPGWYTPYTPFTFVTDENGAGSWHVNLHDSDFTGPNTYSMSVWINESGTILVSDSFDVVVG